MSPRNPMVVLSVVGARPQFVKLAPVHHALDRDEGCRHVVVHTGQHYDPGLSDVFFTDLGIPTPDEHLEVGSGSHAEQTGTILQRLEPVLLAYEPDWVLVYGDTNSTLAAAVAAVKIHLPLAHLEAGLRSFNRRMPEEHNRVLTDHASDLLLAPTDVARRNLMNEGLGAGTIVVGDVMTDVCLDTARSAPAWEVPIAAPGGYLVATVHRAENTDDRHQLSRILRALRALPLPVVLSAHPRLVARASAAGEELGGGSLVAIDPLRYPQLVAAVMGSRGVVTDSGGLQKEAYLLGVPCTTLRTETEWVETLANGWNVLDPSLDQLDTLAARPAPTARRGTPYGDGHAADRVVEALLARRR